MKKVRSVVKSIAAIGALSLASSSFATGFEKTYEITVTNITKGISFTPFIAASHTRGVDVFEVGELASKELAAIAEGGDIGPLMEVLLASKKVSDVQATLENGLLAPGASVSFEVDTYGKKRFLSLAAMLLPTNDTFVGLDSVRLPYRGKVTYYAKAYDAGSEPNDEYCANIPGPVCGGAGGSPDEGGEGYIYPSPGIHGEGDLLQSAYNWDGPVAKVTISVKHKYY